MNVHAHPEYMYQYRALVLEPLYCALRMMTVRIFHIFHSLVDDPIKSLLWFRSINAYSYSNSALLVGIPE
jgi:hypothetical protein